MKTNQIRNIKYSALILCFIAVVFVSFRSSAQDIIIEGLRKEPLLADITLKNTWKAGNDSLRNILAPAGLNYQLPLNTVESAAYLVHSDTIDKKGYGGALNLKYFTGLSYDHIRNMLPGKTVSLDVFIPKESVSPNLKVPNRLRVTIKSERNGIWAEYYTDTAWRRVYKEGTYHFDIKLPDKPAKMESGKTFYPDHAALICVEYYLLEGSEHHSYITFYFNNFKIDGIDFDPNLLSWQLMKNGYVVKDAFLPSITAGSSIIRTMGNSSLFQYGEFGNLAGDYGSKNYTNDNLFVTMPVFIPKNLRTEEGALAFTIKDKKSGQSVVRKFDSCNAEGKIMVTLPLKGLAQEKNIENIVNNKKISLALKTIKPHGPEMEPFIIEPMQIKMGHLIPFDDKWKARDVQGLGAYKYIEIRRDNVSNGISVKELKDNLFQLDSIIRLKGGIDWNNPYYRVELMRLFDKAAVNMENLRLEVSVSPLTDTTDLWQKPYRVRLGLLDANGKVMFGPNFSLSEGVTKLLYLDVSTTNPLPRGIIMPGFDAKNIKAILINFEATHARVGIRDLRLQIANLSISRAKYKDAPAATPIDFSSFTRDPETWQITKLIKDSGGYIAGINYPFPVVDVPKDVMEIPQVYPTVGKKTGDKIHLGFSSDTTKKQVIEDFKKFAANKIDVVRVFALGHLEGVFMWGADGKDIDGFGNGKEDIIKKIARMKIEDFTKYLRENDETFFAKTSDGIFLGLEAHVIDDFMGLLDALEEVEKQTGKKILVILSMYDFMFADGITKEGPRGKYNVGEHPSVATDPLVKAKAGALLWKILRILSQDKRFYEYIACVEVMNEPANAAALVTKENFTTLINFTAESLYLFKDAVGPKMPVTIGFESWKDNLKYWGIVADGIDIMMPHYWESLESYNINQDGLWRLDTPAEELWKSLGTKSNGRPTGIGEISPGGNLKKNLFTIEKAGYDFALAWSYSGHDGHDVKPVMDSIAQYQTGTHALMKLKKKYGEELKPVFIYLMKLRSLFEAERKVLTDESEDEFLFYISNEAKNDTAGKITEIINNIRDIAILKGIPLTRRNIAYLRSRSQ